MTPLTGGIASAHLESVADKAAKLVTSHAGALTRTPMVFNSLINATEVSEIGPDRESNRRYLAPLHASHFAVLRPSPPSPPAIRYVLSVPK